MIGYLLVGIFGAYGLVTGVLEGNLALILLGGFLSLVMAAAAYVEQNTDSTEKGAKE